MTRISCEQNTNRIRNLYYINTGMYYIIKQ